MFLAATTYDIEALETVSVLCGGLVMAESVARRGEGGREVFWQP